MKTPHLVVLVAAQSLAACGAQIDPDDRSAIPERPTPTVTEAVCDEGGKPFHLTADEIVDANLYRAPVGPVYAAFSGCKESASVVIEPGARSTIFVGATFLRSVLAYGPGYFPTRGTAIGPSVLAVGDVTTAAMVLPEAVWRPRLPRYRSDAPTMVVLVSNRVIEPSTCPVEGATVHVEAPGAKISYIDSAPSYAVSERTTTSSSGVVVIDGLVAGEAPSITLTPSACSVKFDHPAAPLENGVVSLRVFGLGDP